MRLSEITEGLDSNQRRAGQVGAEEKAGKVSPVLGKEGKQHPYKGRLVGESDQDLDEASLATMRDYFAGNKDAKDELEITKQRKYYQELKKKEEEELRKKAALQGGAVTKIGGSIKEVAPPGMEDWIKDRKADFKKRYGDRWEEVLYATAWKRKKNESAEQGVAEGLEEQVYKVVALDKSNALKKPTKLNVKASSIEDVFSRLAANDWYALSINGVEVVAGKRLKQDVTEMDKSQPSHGRDGKISHSTYGSRDKGGSAGPERTAKMTTADRMMKDAYKAMMKSMSQADKVKKGWAHPDTLKKNDVEESNDEKIADRYDQDEWDEKMQRLKKLAGAGPLKTVWDPVKRVYKNVPVNQKSEDR